MSDGPHRSLPMRRAWKKVAECGANRAFASEEVSQRIAPALEEDCRAELAPVFIDALQTLYGSLFRNQIESELEGLRNLVGPGIGRVILDHAIQLAADGEIGPDVPLKVVSNGLADRAQRCSRQVEEHYLRESSDRKAKHVRNRIDDGISKAATAVEALARRILKIESGSSTRPQKQDGLDDGVRF
jgi:hypothetical protein